ncbi:conserved protein of unknown function [Ectopseudomonas oleovorans]|uniref:Uncharacterized protein n=2 Tax=Ectopseudomonas TaxID=3236654 RepID=A0A653B7S4_ECTOL|nr:conserved protein of unknown function [Pseudomonas oleovorans]
MSFTAILEGLPPGLSPLARYVCLRLVSRVCTSVDSVADEEELLGQGTKALAKVFGMADVKFAAATAELLKEGVFLDFGVSTGRGRPRRMLRVSDKYRQLQRENPVATAPGSELILRLLALCCRSTESVGGEAWNISRARAARKGGRLSVLNCLLACALCAKADSVGLVQGISMHDLVKWTGLDLASVKHRIRRLAELGFIAVYVPGGNSPLLTHKRKSLYVMNLAHQAFQGLEPVRFYPILPPASDAWGWTLAGVAERFGRLEQLRLEGRRRTLLEAMMSWVERPEGRIHFLWAATDAEFFSRWLPWLICGYVETVLQSESTQVSMRALVRALLPGKISEDFSSRLPGAQDLWLELWNHYLPIVEAPEQPEPKWEADSPQPKGSSQRGDVVTLICRYVFEVIQAIKSQHPTLSESQLKGARLLWFDHEEQGRGLVLALGHR